jgi:hypothetical protein
VSKRRALTGKQAWRDERTIATILGPKDYAVLGRFLSGTYRLIQKIEAADTAIRLSHRRGLKMSDGLSDEARAALEGLADCLAGFGATESPDQTPRAEKLRLLTARKRR